MLLRLLTLLPSDPLSEKVKSWSVESMIVEPNVKSLDKASVYIQQQESDSIASKGMQEDKKVSLVKPQDDPTKVPKKEILCKMPEDSSEVQIRISMCSLFKERSPQ